MREASAKVEPTSGGSGLSLSLKKLHVAICVIVVLATAVAYGLNFAAACLTPFSLNYEAPMLWASMRLAAGQNIYCLSALTAQPWTAILYPPLFMALGAVSVKLLGGAYLGLRLVNMLSAALCALALFRLLRLYDCSKLVAFTAAAFFLNFIVVATLSFEARPDLLAVCLSAWTMERFVAALKQEPGCQALRGLGAVVALAILACLAKQSSIVFVLSIVFFLLSAGQRILALKFLAAWAGAIALIFGGIELICGGFLANLTLLSAVHPQAKVLADNFRALATDWFKVFLGLAIAPVGILAHKGVKGIDTLPLLLLLISFSLLLYTMAIPASNMNHLIPALFALSWWIGLSLRYLPGWVGAVVLIVCAGNIWFLSEFGRLEPLLLPYARESEKVLRRLDLKDRLVLTDDPFINVLTGSKPAMVDCATFLNLWKDTKPQMKDLIGAIESRQYAAIMINSDDSEKGGGQIWWTPSVVQAIKANYVRREELHCSGWFLDLYLPAESGKQGGPRQMR